MDEGIHQQAGDGAIQIGQARDVTLNLVTGITRLPTDYASRIQNFLIEYLGTPEQPVPFGGRDADLARLDAWLADPQAPPYLLLAAPAGRGKSALLVRWSQHLLAQSDTSLVFVPVSIRFRTNLAPVVFAALAARLAHLYGEEVPQTTDLTAEQRRGLVSTYLARTLSGGRSLLLILDGVDEAADWEPGPDLFPLDPPPGLRVIVSARYQAGDADATPWLRRLGWERPGLACSLELDPLARSGVADVLQKMGFPLEVLARDVDIVTELHRLSQGDPLLVRLYVDDLWAWGEAAARLRPEDLRTIHPGLKGYFDRWWEDQRRLWGLDAPLKEPAVQALLNLLACALGPLNQEDVLALTGDLGLTTWALVEALRPLTRLVIGDGETEGVILTSPRAKALAGLASHLPELLLQEALTVAREIEREWARAEALAGLAPRLAELGYPEEAMATAWEIERGWQRAKVLAELAPKLPRSLLQEALAAARAIRDMNARAEALAGLAPRLAELGYLDEVMATVWEIEWKPAQAKAMAGLIPYLPELECEGVMQEALTAAREIEDKSRRAEALTVLAISLGVGQP